MNARQRIFAAEYIKNGKIGVQAVFAAGYKVGYNSACVQASRLLRNAKIKSMIDNVTDKALNAAELTEERVKKEIATVAFSQVKEIDSSAKMKGLDLATKILGMVTQKVEQTDTSERDATAQTLLSAIAQAAQSDNLSEQQAAVQLYTRMRQHPQLGDVNSYPPQFRDALLALDVQPDVTVTEIGDQ